MQLLPVSAYHKILIHMTFFENENLLQIDSTKAQKAPGFLKSCLASPKIFICIQK